MNQKHQVKLGEVQETLLIPLYGRAVETGKQRALLRDPKAVEMVEAIEYDFARFDGGRSPFGTVLRTALIDWWVSDFLADHPAGTVVEIGCGLNTRFERLDNGQVSWVDLDLPDAIEMRRQFFTETERRRMLAGSVLDPSWIVEVKARPGPYFFAIEAVLSYLPEPDARRALSLIVEHFGEAREPKRGGGGDAREPKRGGGGDAREPQRGGGGDAREPQRGRSPGARVALDTSGRWIVANQDRHDALSKVAAKMAWGCDDPRELEQWVPGLRLLDSRDLSQLPAPLRRRLPVSDRITLPVAKVLLRQRFARYKVSLFEVTGA